MKVRFEAELNGEVARELEFWGLKIEDVVRDSMEHSILGSIRRLTNNRCRKCKKLIESTIPQAKKGKIKDYCKC